MMSTTGKILMAIGIVLCFIWLSQFNKIAEPSANELGRMALYSTLPIFLTGLIVYFRAKARLVKK